MREVGTNVVVHHLTGNDPQQADKARTVFGLVEDARLVAQVIGWAEAGVDFASGSIFTVRPVG